MTRDPDAQKATQSDAGSLVPFGAVSLVSLTCPDSLVPYPYVSMPLQSRDTKSANRSTKFLTYRDMGGTLLRDPTHSFGTPLCQEGAGIGVLGWVMAGPGSGLSEESVWGCEPAALESESFPRCPPGPVLAPLAARLMASSSMVL